MKKADFNAMNTTLKNEFAARGNSARETMLFHAYAAHFLMTNEKTARAELMKRGIEEKRATWQEFFTREYLEPVDMPRFSDVQFSELAVIGRLVTRRDNNGTVEYAPLAAFKGFTRTAMLKLAQTLSAKRSAPLFKTAEELAAFCKDNDITAATGKDEISKLIAAERRRRGLETVKKSDGKDAKKAAPAKKDAHKDATDSFEFHYNAAVSVIAELEKLAASNAEKELFAELKKHVAAMNADR